MTLNEFNEIRTRAHTKALEYLENSMNDIQNLKDIDMGTLLFTISIASIFAAEHAIYETLIEEGFLSEELD